MDPTRNQIYAEGESTSEAKSGRDDGTIEVNANDQTRLGQQSAAGFAAHLLTELHASQRQDRARHASSCRQAHKDGDQDLLRPDCV